MFSPADAGELLDMRRGATMLGIWKHGCGLGTRDTVQAWRGAAWSMFAHDITNRARTGRAGEHDDYTVALIMWYLSEAEHLGYVPSPEVTAFLA